MLRLLRLQLRIIRKLFAWRGSALRLRPLEWLGEADAQGGPGVDCVPASGTHDLTNQRALSAYLNARERKYSDVAPTSKFALSPTPKPAGRRSRQGVEMRCVRGKSRGARRFGNLRYGRLGSLRYPLAVQETLPDLRPSPLSEGCSGAWRGGGTGGEQSTYEQAFSWD